MIRLEDVIRIYITYKGLKQRLFTDYDDIFDIYLNYHEQELKKCSLFENDDRENTLAIRYKDHQFIIYHTDERAAIWGETYICSTAEDAITMYLKLLC